ncbi:MAG TPA: amidohydrolase [Thermoanaerobaculia bacterium]|nr:amidohydrolase [Thermoanaerobaculia bacterium]
MRTETLVLTNGKIWTGHSFAHSITIRWGRIVSLDDATPNDARVIDLRGRLAVPGFIDNHLHFVTGSLQLERVQLRDARSLDLFVERIAERASHMSAGSWITGGGWDEQSWSPAVPPARQHIDALTPGHPVFVTRLDLHMGLANSVALRLAGITRETPDPPGGTIVRDGRGEPTGILKDTAMRLVTSIIPVPSVEERVAVMRRGLHEAARRGITSFCDMGITAEAFDDFRAYQRLDREGALTARVWMYLPIDSWERLADIGVEKGFGSEQLRLAGLKAFADGSLGSSTAAFREPYEGEPHDCGLLMQPMQDGSMARAIAGADAHELQLAIHAIGDRANAEVLSLFESHAGHDTRRFRIEHAQHLDPALVERFAKGRIIASMQPYHAIDDGRWAITKIGAHRIGSSFPFRSLLDAGAHVTFGSDWPVAPLDPMLGIHAAVTRQTVDGRNPDGWIPEQKISVAEALRAYTANNAFAVFAEREIGTLAPGLRADLAILSDDLFTVSPGEIERVRVEMTISGGRVIYEE